MAHKTLIGGTAYSVKGGKNLIGGTAYKVSSGKTLINGTGYGINFVVTETVTSSVVSATFDYLKPQSEMRYAGFTKGYYSADTTTFTINLSSAPTRIISINFELRQSINQTYYPCLNPQSPYLTYSISGNTLTVQAKYGVKFSDVSDPASYYGQQYVGGYVLRANVTYE